jgi:hypothetical protein
MIEKVDKVGLTALDTTAQAIGISAERRAAIRSAATGDIRKSIEPRPALLTQAAKAKQLGVSRFTIRKLARAGRLHPIELLPGLLRYRADELV